MQVNKLLHYCYYLSPALPHTPLHPWRPKSTQYTLTEDLLADLGKQLLTYQSRPVPDNKQQSRDLTSAFSLQSQGTFFTQLSLTWAA